MNKLLVVLAVSFFFASVAKATEPESSVLICEGGVTLTTDLSEGTVTLNVGGVKHTTLVTEGERSVEGVIYPFDRGEVFVGDGESPVLVSNIGGVSALQCQY